MSMERIGFVGLGIMGKPMAKNLLKKGYELTVYDLNQAAMDEVAAAGAQKAESPMEVARRGDVIFTMLPNSPQVKEAVLAENGICAGISAGKILVDMSSIAPLASQELARALAVKGCEMLDAPVSGGEPKAVDGTLAIMAGGSNAAFERVKDILLCMGATAVLVGEIGSGNVTKLANQIIVALNIAAVSEAMTLASKANVDPAKVFDAIKGGLAGSTVLNAKMPMILARNFNPGFRVELHIKDLNNALDTARELGAAVPLTEQVLGFMNSLSGRQLGKADHCALVQYYEGLSNTEVKYQ